MRQVSKILPNIIVRYWTFRCWKFTPGTVLFITMEIKNKQMIEYQPTLPIFKRGKQNYQNRPNSSLHIQRNNHFQEHQLEEQKCIERLRSRQSQKVFQQYSQSWENQILRKFAQDIVQETQLQQLKQIQYQGDRLPRQIQSKITDKHGPKLKRKDFEKYKAYAVKMKIPSFQDITKDKQKESKQHSKAAINAHHLQMIENLIQPKLSFINQIALKEHFLRYESTSNQIEVPKREIKTSVKQRKIGIRKRSIKTSEKRSEKEMKEIVRKIESNYSRYSPSSPKGYTKFKINLQKEKAITNEPGKTIDTKEEHKDHASLTDKISPRTNKKLLFDSEKSSKPIPKKQRVSVSPHQDEQDNANYLQKGISFKKKIVGKPVEEKNIEVLHKKLSKDITIIKEESKNISRLNKQFSQQKQKKQSTFDESPYLQSLKESPNKNIKRKARELIKARQKGLCELEKKQSKELQSPTPVKPSRKGKVLVFNSEDKYIKRILLSKNWILNHDTQSHFYNLKWVFKPIPQDYNNLTQKQFLNHIKNSHQLTSKNYLNKNLKHYLSQWTSLYKHYPKCYDFSKNDQKQEFQKQYTNNCMMLLLRKLFSYLKEQVPTQIEKYQKKYEQLLQADGTYQIESKFYSPMRKKQFKSIDLENYRFFNPNFTIHINCIIMALKYWRNLRKLNQLEEDYHYHFLTFNPKEFQLNYHYLQEYSRLSTMTFDPGNEQAYFIKEYYSTPSSLTIQRIVKEYVYFQNNFGKEWRAFGDHNIWIIKPCSASRGNGIYLESNSSEILFNSKGIQSKIVQKYIERPLLFSSPPLLNKKFDIRQWVLLHSINPLEIYIFSHCYIRICSEQYSISNIHNLKSHLTNYSFNKKHFKDSSESVLDYDSFQQLLKEECSVDYESQIKPKIKDIIIQSIKAGQEHLYDLNKRCFSLLGYDILLDEECNPWLLEINMSPACQERTEWLKEYLKSMGEGMLKIVLPEEYWENCDIERSQSKQIVRYDRSGMKDEIKMEQQHLNRVHTQLSQQLNNQQKLNIFPKEVIDPRSQDEQLLQMSYDLRGSQREDQNKEEIINKSNVNPLSDLFFDSDQEDWERVYNVDYQDNFKEDGGQQATSQFHANQDKQPSQNDEAEYLETISNKEQQQQSNNFKVFPQNMKWQLICSQDYLFPSKKDPENFEVVGNKLTVQALRQKDIQIDQYEQSRNHLERSILLLQHTIRCFLARKNLKKEKKRQQFLSNQQKFGITFSRMGRNFSERDSRLVVLQENLPGSSIWHYNYYHTYREHAIQKQLIEQQKNYSNRNIRNSYRQLKSKGSPEHQLKDKIKSFISESHGHLVSQLELNGKVKREERVKTETLQADETEKKEMMKGDLLRSVQRISKRTEKTQ